MPKRLAPIMLHQTRTRRRGGTEKSMYCAPLAATVAFPLRTRTSTYVFLSYSQAPDLEGAPEFLALNARWCNMTLLETWQTTILVSAIPMVLQKCRSQRLFFSTQFIRMFERSGRPSGLYSGLLASSICLRTPLRSLGPPTKATWIVSTGTW